MRLSPSWMLLVLAACSTTNTTETADSTASVPDTVAVDTEVADNGEVVSYPDTTITETLEVESAFSEAQIKPTIAYVYSEGGLDVYEKNLPLSSAGQKVIGYVEYQSAITLTQPLVNSTSSDTMKVAGLKGRLVEVAFEGKPGFVFSGYLLNLPVPEHGEVAAYFDQFLHLVQPAVQTRRECDCDGMFSEEKYQYEQGIVITNSSYYESYDHSIIFPNSMTLQEVFLFARYFYKNLKEDFPEFPAGPLNTELENGKSMLVEATNNGNIFKIIAITGEGCYEEEGVTLEETGVKMSANGGC